MEEELNLEQLTKDVIAQIRSGKRPPTLPAHGPGRP